MLDFLSKLFDTQGFPARWHCGDWTQGHGWLHITSDLLVFGAYAAIPISIAAYILVKKQELAFRKLYWLFAGFILSCGLTHLIDATLFWQPWYRLSGSVKLVTAIVSWATVFALVRTLPVAMRLPGTAKLAERLMEEVEERKRSENALRDSSARLSLAMEHSRLGDWSWDAATDVCQFSTRAAELLGLPEGARETWEQVVARIHPEEQAAARQAVRRAILDRGDYEDEYRVRHADGREIWISAKGRAQYDGEGHVTSIVGTLADVTERRQADHERERLLANESAARAEAERANRMKDEFLATLSHELRTPLHAILGWVNMLREDHSDERELRAGLEVIQRNTQVQARLIEDLLDMSRIISGKVRLDVQQVELASVIEAALDAVRPWAESRKIRLIHVLDPLAGPVRGDSARIQQIVWNLLSNAIKFTPPGGKVEVTLERVNSHVEISVSDNGCGIAPEVLPHIFDRFRQADSSFSRRHGGLGLGLSIVRHLAEMHGGSVQAKSPGIDQGATFRVILPLPAAHPERGDAGDGEIREHPAAASHVSQADSSKPDLTGARVLIVDDEVDSRDLVRRILKGQGAEVVAAASGAEALAAMREQSFDTLVSDIGMPGMDGYQLIRQIRALPPAEGGHVPAIVLSAFARAEDRRRAMNAGFDMFVSKPADPLELLAAVHRSVSRGKAAFQHAS
jgi:PAS domain S-box-containing protein